MKLVVPKKSSSDSSEMINKLREVITDYLKEHSTMRFDSYNCGSYYDKSKVYSVIQYSSVQKTKVLTSIVQSGISVYRRFRYIWNFFTSYLLTFRSLYPHEWMYSLPDNCSR